MVCVWEGIIAGLSLTGQNQQYNPQELLKYVQENNKDTPNVKINTKLLSKQEIEENKEHIKLITSAYNGYLCSTSDPLFCLVSELFNVNIIHEYNSSYGGHNHKAIIHYDIGSTKTLHFSSNNSHFNFSKFENKDLRNIEILNTNN